MSAVIEFIDLTYSSDDEDAQPSAPLPALASTPAVQAPSAQPAPEPTTAENMMKETLEVDDDEVVNADEDQDEVAMHDDDETDNEPIFDHAAQLPASTAQLPAIAAQPSLVNPVYMPPQLECSVCHYDLESEFVALCEHPTLNTPLCADCHTQVPADDETDREASKCTWCVEFCSISQNIDILVSSAFRSSMQVWRERGRLQAVPLRCSGCDTTHSLSSLGTPPNYAPPLIGCNHGYCEGCVARAFGSLEHPLLQLPTWTCLRCDASPLAFVRGQLADAQATRKTSILQQLLRMATLDDSDEQALVDLFLQCEEELNTSFQHLEDDVIDARRIEVRLSLIHARGLLFHTLLSRVVGTE
jgi:hypothetical protein